jgi:hypothetical protein
MIGDACPENSGNHCLAVNAHANSIEEEVAHNITV